MPYPHTSTRYARYIYRWRSTYPTFGAEQKSSRLVTLPKVTNGTNLPNWRAVIAAGGDATNALATTVDTFVTYPGFIRTSWMFPGDPKYYEDYIRGYYAAAAVQAPGSMDPSLMSVAEARALSNFNEECRKTSNAFSGGVFLGELREARDMLRHPAKSLFEGIGKYLGAVSSRHKASKEYARAQRNKPRQHAGRKVDRAEQKIAEQESLQALGKIAAESWLEYSFGWVPFLNDIRDAFEALDNLRNEVRYVPVSSGGQADKEGMASADVYGSLANYAFYKRTYRVRQRVHVRYKGALKIEPQTATADYAKNWGVHTSHFIPTVWELLPWSFLADYFGNIGDILNFDNTVFQNLVWCSRGTKSEYTCECVVEPWRGKAKEVLGSRLISSEGSQSYAAYKRMLVTRGKGAPSNLTITDVHLKLPGLETQWLNMAALLTSANSVNAQRFNRW
jgi:hypothetical protein